MKDAKAYVFLLTLVLTIIVLILAIVGCSIGLWYAFEGEIYWWFPISAIIIVFVALLLYKLEN